MKLRIPRLTSLKGLHAGGFGHVELIVAVLVVGLFGFVGYRVIASHADPLLTSTTCQLRGRVWASNGCTKTCLSGAGSHVVANPYDYCSGALSKVSASVCAANGRKWLNVGCARRWQQTNLKGAIQCVSASATYTVANPYDKCVVAASVTCTVSTPSTEKKAYGNGPIDATVLCNNNSSQSYTQVTANLYAIKQGATVATGTNSLSGYAYLNSVPAGRTIVSYGSLLSPSSPLETGVYTIKASFTACNGSWCGQLSSGSTSTTTLY